MTEPPSVRSRSGHERASIQRDDQVEFARDDLAAVLGERAQLGQHAGESMVVVLLAMHLVHPEVVHLGNGEFAPDRGNIERVDPLYRRGQERRRGAPPRTPLTTRGVRGEGLVAGDDCPAFHVVHHIFAARTAIAARSCDKISDQCVCRACTDFAVLHPRRKSKLQGDTMSGC